MRAVTLFAGAAVATAGDPASSWLTYAVWKDPQARRITALNTTWTVPSNPATSSGSNAPGWWFGTQTKDGNGALVQPILAYGYQGNFYSIFNGVYDWTDGGWHTSQSITVQPGDKIVSSVTTKDGETYLMEIAHLGSGKTISTPYKLERRQTETESTAYFVLEHQPRTCRAYPTNGVCEFENIYLEVEGQEVANPQWEAKQERPACDSQTTIVDPRTIKITWNANSDDIPLDEVEAPRKWQPAAVQV
jgi:hypothetical protein